MSTYWVTFRIHDAVVNGNSYDERYKAFYAAMNKHAKMWWVPPTSFAVFDSDIDIDAISTALKAPLSAANDMFLLGMTDYKSARIFGKNDDLDIYKLIPFLKKA